MSASRTLAAARLLGSRAPVLPALPLRSLHASASSAAAGNPHYNDASPHLKKVWASYSFTRNQRVQMLSPFEVDTLGPLFSNIGPKLKHKIEDNFWDVAPSVLFFVLLVTFVKAKRQDMLVHHRD